MAITQMLITELSHTLDDKFDIVDFLEEKVKLNLTGGLESKELEATKIPFPKKLIQTKKDQS